MKKYYFLVGNENDKTIISMTPLAYIKEINSYQHLRDIDFIFPYKTNTVNLSLYYVYCKKVFDITLKDLHKCTKITDLIYSVNPHSKNTTTISNGYEIDFKYCKIDKQHCIILPTITEATKDQPDSF